MRKKKSELEFIRTQAKEKFEYIKQDWIDAGDWILPHRTKWLNQQEEGRRNNRHLVDGTPKLALRSCVAGFLEGNTSASRAWFRQTHQDDDRANFPKNREYLEILTRRALYALGRSNYYHEAGAFYYDFNVYNTGAHFIEEIQGRLHFHTLVPGSYYVINGDLGEAMILVREYPMTIYNLVKKHGRKKNGVYDWSNFSDYVKRCYENSDYNYKVDVVHIIMPNEDFDPNKPVAASNRQWVQIYYETGTTKAQYGSGITEDYRDVSLDDPNPVYLDMSFSKRKPFIVGRSQSSNNYEYGETGPTTDCLGMIKSLNKKAVSKDMGIEKLLEPTLQGPMSLKKSYLTNMPRGFVPLDPTAMAQGGLKPINQIGQGWQLLAEDVTDLRRMIEKFFYADFLMFLMNNPKTRTAAEVNAVVNEQQIVIGPQLQALNFTYNTHVVDFVTDFVIDTDPYLPPPPEDLQGEMLKIDFISVFAQAQKAADLPNVERYIQAMMGIGQVNPQIWSKVNLDKLADLYENRLYLPYGINRDQKEVDQMRQQAQAQAERQQMMQETLPAMAGAAKDASAAAAPRGGQGQ